MTEINSELHLAIAEDQSRLVTLNRAGRYGHIGVGNNGLGNSSALNDDVRLIIESLKQDQVVLVQGLTSDNADCLMHAVATALGLAESLQLQAGFASSIGHRENIGRYYMSVNKRDNYQFVAPHSEGSSFINLQLASFYCYENTTDGGETILMNTNPTGEIWGQLREQLRRGKADRPLTAPEIQQIKIKARLNMPEDTLREDDEILTQVTVAPGFTVYDVLAKPQKTWSQILMRDLYVYWDTIESTDRDSAEQFHQYLSQQQLLKQPQNPLSVPMLDDSESRRVRHFGSRLEQLFKCKITRKLAPGDFIIQNNLTWTHSVNNWTPGSGIRKVAAAFA